MAIEYKIQEQRLTKKEIERLKRARKEKGWRGKNLTIVKHLLTLEKVLKRMK